MAKTKRPVPSAETIAEKIAIVHTCPKERFIEIINGQMELKMSRPWGKPSSARNRDDTNTGQKKLGIRPAVFLFAGRACKGFGDTAMAFSPICEEKCSAFQASPCDSGELAKRADQTKSFSSNHITDHCIIEGNAWRREFAAALKELFKTPLEYWTKIPRKNAASHIKEKYPLVYHFKTGYRHPNLRPEDFVKWTYEIRLERNLPLSEAVRVCGPLQIKSEIRNRLSEIGVGEKEIATLNHLNENFHLNIQENENPFEGFEAWIRKEAGLN